MRKLRGSASPPARAVILTAPDEEYVEFHVMVSGGDSSLLAEKGMFGRMQMQTNNGFQFSANCRSLETFKPLPGAV